jgi:hypothetical protein
LLFRSDKFFSGTEEGNRGQHALGLFTHRKVKDDLGICHLDIFNRIRKDPGATQHHDSKLGEVSNRSDIDYLTALNQAELNEARKL